MVIIAVEWSTVGLTASTHDTRELERWFKGMADATRLRILNLLLHGELCVCDIQHVLKALQPTVSRHLAYLRNAGLVQDRRDGYRIFYRLANPDGRAKRRIYQFLRDTFVASDAFEDDNRRLREVIRAGACTLGEWRPYGAIARRSASRR